jgi:hypothetical protein
MATAEALKATADLALSDSESKQLNDLIDSLKTRVTVDEKMLNSSSGEVPVPVAKKSVSAEVDEYFKEKKSGL